MTPIVFKVFRLKVKVTVTLVENLFSIYNCQTIWPRIFKLAVMVGYDYMMTPIVLRSKIKVTVTFSCKTGLNVLAFDMLQD